MGKIMRVNMSELKVSLGDTSSDYSRLGGRGLTSTIISAEVPTTCHPLGAKNKLIIAPGMLSGTPAVCSGRLSVGFKSPLTGGIKESNVGGTPSFKIARLGIDAIVLEGAGENGLSYILHVSKDGGKLIPGGEYQGLKNYDLVKKLQSRYGGKVGVLSIGPVGEMRLSTASVASTDTSGVPSRHAGRGGGGAVMGSKGIKAIVIDDRGAPGVRIVDPERFREGTRKYASVVRNHPVSKGLRTFGTDLSVNTINTAGAYPTRNFRQGTFEGAGKVCGEYLHQVITERGGDPSHVGCATCIIHCSNVYVDKKRDYITSAFEYETICFHGANLGISDLDSIARADRLCDEYGIDTIEIGAAIGVAMEAGARSFGDAQGALELIEEVGKGTPLGRILGSGAWVTGKVFGVTRVPTVKRQAMAGYDPRAIHGMGVNYATSPMGADHTVGWIVPANLPSLGGKLHPHKAAGQVDLSRKLQIEVAAMDSTGLCNFVNDMLEDGSEGRQGFLNMMGARYGVEYTEDDLVALGKKVLKTEREFNLAAGLTKADDRLPEFFKEEKIPPHNVSFTVADDELDRLFDF